ncbi:TetR/AcrR family transcriptional regulator [Cryptosporangium aurantiacum]|uniref:Transcriptional regulator, TetR family n=1 Tax=Cryptosporangium aurantiacum TaxID=134849 RepID=A0A1M7PFJ3_9ACTN|nr:TetR family transcriptional regulator [Cryptosporangium aurantiacum]SHN15752.1 transcriptional regulator, TetR family [Cryptosporangium aurantiacum]
MSEVARLPAASARTATGRAGAKGRRTRQRLLEEVERRCLRAPCASVAVSDVAQATGLSPATFYHYFPDVPTAVAEVAERHMVQFEDVTALAAALVRDQVNKEKTEEFVRAFYDFWADRRGLLETIVVASRDEDPRVFRVLLNAMKRLTHVLSVAVSGGHPVGVAGSLVMMLVLSAARREGFERDGAPLDAQIRSQAEILHAALASTE